MKKIALVLMILCSISLCAQNSSSNENVKSIEIGDMFRELIVPDSNDVKVKLSDYCGKGYYTLLEFGVTWCGPCKKDVPILKGVYDKYHPYGLNLISVFLDEEKDAWKRYIKKNAINWIHLCDLKGGKHSQAVEVYSIKTVPFYLIINPQGKVVYKKIGGLKPIGGLCSDNTLEPKLKELYGF